MIKLCEALGVGTVQIKALNAIAIEPENLAKESKREGSDMFFNFRVRGLDGIGQHSLRQRKCPRRDL